MPDLDRRLSSVAIDQHSLLTLDDVITAGGSRSHARRRVEAGRWEPLSPGVYRISGVPWTYEATVLAGILAAGPGAVASHRCAARLLGIGFARAEPELSVPRGRNHRPSGVLVHQSTDLDRAATVHVLGIPVTEPARTLLDLARYIGPLPLRRAIEQSRRTHGTTWAELIRCLADHARQGRHGVRRLRRVIATGMSTNEVTDTDSELLGLTVLRESTLPDPVLHHRVHDEDGDLLAELDFAWPDRLAALELDGLAHLDPEVRRHDEARDHELRRRGWTVRRAWWEMPVCQPDAFVRLARDLLRDAPTRS